MKKEGILMIPAPSQAKELVEAVWDDFSLAEADRRTLRFGYDAKGGALDYDGFLKELNEIYFGIRRPKTVPWKFCSNRSMMIAMAIVEVLHARMFPAAYSEELTHFRPVEKTDGETAKRVSDCMRWWLGVHAPLREFFDRWVRSAISYGQVASEHFWKVTTLERAGGARPVPRQDADGNYERDEEGNVITQEPDTLVSFVETTEAEVLSPEDVFIPESSADIQKDPVILRKKLLYRDCEALERMGAMMNVTKRAWKESPSLKELLSQESEETPVERARLRNQSLTFLRWFGEWDTEGDGQMHQVVAMVELERRVLLSLIAVRDLTESGKRPLDLTIVQPRLDRPYAPRGLGFLEMIRELAKEIDAIFNQFTDANTLSILRPGFVDPASGIVPEALYLQPNRMQKVPNPTRNVFFPDLSVDTNRLVNAVRMVIEFIEKLTGASAYVLGRESEIVGGSGTATRTTAILGSANTRHSIPANRLREGASRIVGIHLDLVQKNLPPGLENRILGSDGKPVFDTNALTREGILGKFDVYQMPDESLGSREVQRSLAQNLYGILLSNPLVLGDPAKIYQPTKDLIESFGQDAERFLGPEPPVNMARSPQEEHTLMLEGRASEVRVTILQNPIEHLISHMEFPKDPAFQALSAPLQQELLTFLRAHVAEHEAVMSQLIQNMRAGGVHAGSSTGRAPSAGGVSRDAQVPFSPAPLESAARNTTRGSSEQSA